MTTKALIFDASTLINLSMNGLLEVLANLKKIFQGKFLITENVRYETIAHPLQIKKFELGALKINFLLKQKIIELPDTLGIDEKEIEEKTKELLNTSNHTFFAQDSYIHLIDNGEASCLALSELLSRKGIKNAIAMDERTTRMLCEKPENLQKLMENKFHIKIKTKKENFLLFSEFKIIRSCELMYIAYKNKLVELENGNVLDALLYAVKYKGCSVSRNEIEEMKKM